MSIQGYCLDEFDIYLDNLVQIIGLCDQNNISVISKDKAVISLSDLFKILHSTLKKSRSINLNNIQIYLSNVSSLVLVSPIYGFMLGIYALKISVELFNTEIVLCIFHKM